MKLVLEFDKLLHSIIEAKAPVSASKIQLITKAALKNEQLFHLVVSSIVKFTQKCPNDFKLSALYVVDSISRAILKANSPNLLVLFQDKLDDIFSTVTNASSKDKEKVHSFNLGCKVGAIMEEKCV